MIVDEPPDFSDGSLPDLSVPIMIQRISIKINRKGIHFLILHTNIVILFCFVYSFTCVCDGEGIKIL
jgi:hypothetical protein